MIKEVKFYLTGYMIEQVTISNCETKDFFHRKEDWKVFPYCSAQ